MVDKKLEEMINEAWEKKEEISLISSNLLSTLFSVSSYQKPGI